MSLPKIEHNLLNTSLTTYEKLEYIKARSVISACLHAESGSCIFDKEKEAISTLNRLNEKMEKM